MPMRQRPTRARNVARFDWDEPPSRVVVSLVPKGDGRTAVTVAHERLPDAEAGEQFKGRWREWLAALKTFLEPDEHRTPTQPRRRNPEGSPLS